jgi:hypothetical protein
MVAYASALSLEPSRSASPAGESYGAVPFERRTSFEVSLKEGLDPSVGATKAAYRH